MLVVQSEKSWRNMEEGLNEGRKRISLSYCFLEPNISFSHLSSFNLNNNHVISKLYEGATHPGFPSKS